MSTHNRYPSNMVRLCIDAYQEDIAGRAYSPLNTEEIQFAGISELFMKLDQVFDLAGYPQATTKKRTFNDINNQCQQYHGIPESPLSVTEMQNREGKIKTYDIIFYSRLNTSWQGMVKSPNDQKMDEFHGELELLDEIITD